MKLYDSGVFLLNGTTIVPEDEAGKELQDKKEQYKTGTISYDILQAHNIGEDKENLKIKFDAITSHDLTYVGIIQTARASGVEKFPLPYQVCADDIDTQFIRIGHPGGILECGVDYRKSDEKLDMLYRI